MIVSGLASAFDCLLNTTFSMDFLIAQASSHCQLPVGVVNSCL